MTERARKDRCPKQYTFCYCPNCRNELISSNSFTEDTALVRGSCTECGTFSEWLFDAPVPILIRSRKGDTQ